MHAEETSHPDEVIVIDIIEDTMGTPLPTTMVQEPWKSGGWLTVRVEPSTQSKMDWGNGWQGYPTVPMIDLRTMKVVEKDCFTKYSTCVANHL